MAAEEKGLYRIDTPPHSTGLAPFDFDIAIAIDYRYLSGAEQNFLMTELARLKDVRAHRGDSGAKRQLPGSSSSSTVRLGTFSDRLNEILAKLEGKLAPTFLFVDPCGVSGASFDTIRAVMENEKCEAFIFFNIDGVRRIAGLSALSPVLAELMGSEERAKALYERLRTTASVGKHEEIILSEYCKALIEGMGAEYIIPFRVEHEDQKKTSHYLIHATKHPLGSAS